MSERRLPLRLIGWSAALLLLALPVAGLMMGWLASDRWPMRTLEVHASYRHVSAQAIRAAVLPYVGKGFFATRLTPVRLALENLPWVASASVRKRWPDTLVIEVHERKPCAHWNQTRLIDCAGKPFTVPDAAQLAGLPQLSGPDNRLDEVLAFQNQVRGELAAVGLKVDGVHLDGRGGWRIDLDRHAALVVGRDAPAARLRRFVSVYPQLAASHAGHFVYADLRYTNGFAVRWPDPATPARNGQGVTRS